jgi:hypothetical protein
MWNCVLNSLQFHPKCLGMEQMKWHKKSINPPILKCDIFSLQKKLKMNPILQSWTCIEFWFKIFKKEFHLLWLVFLPLDMTNSKLHKVEYMKIFILGHSCSPMICYQPNEDRMQKSFNPKLEIVFSFPLKVA